MILVSVLCAVLQVPALFNSDVPPPPAGPNEFGMMVGVIELDGGTDEGMLGLWYHRRFDAVSNEFGFRAWVAGLLDGTEVHREPPLTGTTEYEIQFGGIGLDWTTRWGEFEVGLNAGPALFHSSDWKTSLHAGAFGGGHAAYVLSDTTALTLMADYVRPFGRAEAEDTRAIDDGFFGALGLALRW